MITRAVRKLLFGGGPASLLLGGAFIAVATLTMGNMRIEDLSRSYLVERLAGSHWYVESVDAPILAMFSSSFAVEAVVEDGASHRTIEARVTGYCLASSGCLMQELPNL